MGEPHMADDADMQVLNAAITIRAELVALVPDDADALGVALDEQIARAQAAPAAERPVYLDQIIEILSSHERTRERFYELNPVIDTDRGAPDFWALDQTLAGEVYASDQTAPGEVVQGAKLLSIICQTCQYVNKLPFRPPEDDLPDCQNPNRSPHPLKLP